MVAEMKKKHILEYNPSLAFSDTHMVFWYITQAQDDDKIKHPRQCNKETSNSI